MDVREIIAAGQVASRFQPIVQLSDGRTVAHEALSRGPAGSAVECPRLLFAAAAEQGCELALDVACRIASLRRAADAGWAAGAHGPLFLNVRPGALAEPAFLGELEEAVAAVGRRPGDVVLEVSEAEPMDVDLGEFLSGCRAAGFWIALDDAGAGRCALRTIAEVVPDVVKVDRGLVAGMDQHRGRRATVAALARLARDLGIVLVAEGIETPGELGVVREMGVPLGQGYLLGHPSERILPGGSAGPVDWFGPAPASPRSLRSPAGAVTGPMAHRRIRAPAWHEGGRGGRGSPADAPASRSAHAPRVRRGRERDEDPVLARRGTPPPHAPLCVLAPEAPHPERGVEDEPEKVLDHPEQRQEREDPRLQAPRRLGDAQRIDDVRRRSTVTCTHAW